MTGSDSGCPVKDGAGELEQKQGHGVDPVCLNPGNGLVALYRCHAPADTINAVSYLISRIRAHSSEAECPGYGKVFGERQAWSSLSLSLLPAAARAGCSLSEPWLVSPHMKCKQY